MTTLLRPLIGLIVSSIVAFLTPLGITADMSVENALNILILALITMVPVLWKRKKS